MIQFQWITFNNLTTQLLYEILALRSKVFVVEQNCAYQDIDGNDLNAVHLVGISNGRLKAYLRLLPPSNTSNLYFGRVVTAPDARQSGYGKKLLNELLQYKAQHYPNHSIACSAQLYLENFYQNFGFERLGAPYMEDGIPHIHMRKQ